MGHLFSCFKPFSCPSVLNTLYIQHLFATVGLNPLFLKQYLKMKVSRHLLNYHCSLKLIKCPMSAYSEYTKSTNNFFSCSKNYFFSLSKIGTEFGEIKTKEDEVYKTIELSVKCILRKR